MKTKKSISVNYYTIIFYTASTEEFFDELGFYAKNFDEKSNTFTFLDGKALSVSDCIASAGYAKDVSDGKLEIRIGHLTDIEEEYRMVSSLPIHQGRFAIELKLSRALDSLSCLCYAPGHGRLYRQNYYDDSFDGVSKESFWGKLLYYIKTYARRETAEATLASLKEQDPNGFKGWEVVELK